MMGDSVGSANGGVPTTGASLTARMRVTLVELARGKTSPTLIAEAVKSDRGTVHRTLKSLISRGLAVREDGTRQYFLTAKGAQVTVKIAAEQVPTGVPTDSSRGCEVPTRVPTKRGHNVRVLFPIVQAPVGWRESPKEFFRLQHEVVEWREEFGVSWKGVGLKNVDGVEFALEEVYVRATAHNLVVMTSVAKSGGSTAEVLRWLMPFMFSVKRKLERMFSQLVLGERPVVIWGELAHEGDPVARLKEAEGFRVISHTDGRARVQFDHSKGPLEIEFLHPGLWDGDSEVWERRILQVLDSPYDYDVLGVMVEQAEFKNEEQDARIAGLLRAGEQQLRLIEEVTRNQRVFDANMASHLDVLARLGVAVDELRVTVARRRERARVVRQESLGRWM